MKISKLKKHITPTLLSLALLSLGVFIVLDKGNVSSAADARNFNAGNIMSDFVMTNKSSMNEAQIQSFLVSKNPCNDRNIAKVAANPGYQYNVKNGKFVCLAEESFGGESAARIIWQAAQDYNINPQVLIVLLEKEQGLITDTWPNHVQYRAATGYGCPDTADCNGKYYGFKNQVRNAANFFRAYQTGNTGWYKSVWPGNKYTGTWQPFDYALQYHPNIGCGTATTRIENRATASLYSYTPYRPNQAALNAQTGHGNGCSSYGNRNFWMFFSSWFGSTVGVNAEACDSRVTSVVCVWSVRKLDGSQFLTTSKAEMESAVNRYKWLYEGIAFYASNKPTSSTVPVQRLLRDNKHVYTSSQAEYNTLKQSGEWTDEGVAFYAPPSSISNNTVHEVYSLQNPTKTHQYLTRDPTKRTDLIKQGYSEKTANFGSLSGVVNLSNVDTVRSNIYELRGVASYLYTSNLSEMEQAVKQGYSFEKVLSTTTAGQVGTPIYRLQLGGKYLFTSNIGERDNAIAKYNYTYEGIAFHLDSSSPSIYRLVNTTHGIYRYTSDPASLLTILNKDSWVSDGMLLSSGAASNTSTVYRFLNLHNGRHFYTVDINEASRITNKGWLYENIAFNAHLRSGKPVYRLLSHDKHFYTTNVNERDLAVSRYGYIYEGVGFYVSNTATDTPTYRLQGGNDEYFYTISKTERDTAISRYGYTYEGISFYTP